MTRRRTDDDSGAAALEFALIFGLVVFPLLMGTLQYGYQYWSLQTAAATAREAARQLAVGTDPCLVDREAKQRAGDPAISAVSVSYSPSYSASTHPASGSIVTVTVSFDSLFLGFLPVPNGGRVSQSAEARVQTARAGTARDPFLGLDGVKQAAAATVFLPSCSATTP